MHHQREYCSECGELLPISRSYTYERMNLCSSELPENDVMRRFSAPGPFLLLRVPVLRHCDAFHELHKWRSEYNCDGCTFLCSLLQQGGGKKCVTHTRAPVRAGSVGLKPTKNVLLTTKFLVR
ncbi:hypothetical protein EVAR_74550_1 [Eumeta japonica]|uniref:Uncharacterized protein n=1 Tax=Eumeta variegata TaxID=151549 RepID=A0A4C1TBL6_EUMVA|nr:hypothetical protein EVAR_74550_1 [Eumeta japonica]